MTEEELQNALIDAVQNWRLAALLQSIDETALSPSSRECLTAVRETYTQIRADCTSEADAVLHHLTEAGIDAAPHLPDVIYHAIWIDIEPAIYRALWMCCKPSDITG